VAYKALICPSCGAVVNNAPEGDSFYCQYCGAKIIKDKQYIEVSGNISVSGMASESSLLERGFLFLEDKDFESADSYFEKVLDINPKNSKAYIGKLLADEEKENTDELIKSYKYNLENNEYFSRAIRFASDKERKEYDELINVNRQQHKNRIKRIDNQILETKDNYNTIIELYEKTKFSHKKASFLNALICTCLLVLLFGGFAVIAISFSDDSRLPFIISLIPIIAVGITLGVIMKNTHKKVQQSDEILRMSEDLENKINRLNRNKKEIINMFNK